MNTLLIRELLEPFGICRQEGDDVSVHEALLFEPGAPDAENRAYVVCDSAVRGRYRHALIIAIGETDIAADHLIRLSGGTVSAVMNSLIRVLWRLERLNEALYGASGSQEVIDIAARKTRLPFFYFDDSYRIIAISRKIYYALDDEWRHMTEKGYLSPGTVRRMSENGDLDYLAASDEPVIYDSPLFPFVCVSCNVRYQSAFKGRINMLVVDRDAYQEHLEICRIVHAHLIRLLREGKTPDGNLRLCNLLTDILNEKRVPGEALRSALQDIGGAAEGGFQFYAIDINASGDPQLFNYYTRALERLLTGFRLCVFPHDDRLLALALLQTPARCAAIQARIAGFLQDQHLKCGVSHFFRTLEQARGCWEQALFALNAARDERMVRYEEVLMERLFSFVPDRELPFLLSSRFLALLEADRESSFPMTDTLRRYLENGRNLQRTAEALSIHKNTMLYRLNRIREYIDVDADDFDARVALEVSFLLWNRVNASPRKGS